MPGRLRVDPAFSKTTAFPAAGASNQSASFDLGAHGNAATGIFTEGIEAQISWPTLAALADTKNVLFTLQDSADNASFASVNPLITKTITGAGGIGVAAGAVKFRIPAGVRQFMRVQATEDAAGGVITASSYTFSLLF